MRLLGEHIVLSEKLLNGMHFCMYEFSLIGNGFVNKASKKCFFERHSILIMHRVHNLSAALGFFF